MPRSTCAALAAACSIFTVAHVAWADAAHEPLGEVPDGATDPRWVDSPYAPHHPSGATFRAGTEVGFVYGKRFEVLALGGGIAVGHRWDRLTIESGYDYLGFSEIGASSLSLGHAHRLSVTARVEPIRFGSSLVGQNSMLAVYVEASLARQFETWDHPEYNEPSRVVPDSGSHSEGAVGFGLMLDHRLERPSSVSRVGWLLGWRLVAAPDAPDTYTVCRGTVCARGEPAMPMQREYATALLFTSSLSLTW